MADLTVCITNPNLVVVTGAKRVRKGTAMRNPLLGLGLEVSQNVHMLLRSIMRCSTREKYHLKTLGSDRWIEIKNKN